MIRYYPANRVKTSQITTGGTLNYQGQEYVGYYYETFDGKTFSGKTPSDPDGNQPLTPTDEVDSRSSIVNAESAGKDPNLQLNYLTPYYPKPTPEEYARGYFIRYFAKKVNSQESIIEISKENYAKMKESRVSLEDYLYQVTDLFWQISGPLYDDRVNKQYPVAGIVNTNKRLVENKNKTFPGIKAYIGEEYTKYAVPS